MISDEDSGFLWDVHLGENDYGAGFIERMIEVFKKHNIAPKRVKIRHAYLEHEIQDERAMRLCDLPLDALKSFVYEYDFGDGEDFFDSFIE